MKFSQCGDCNKMLEPGEVLYNIGGGEGIWVCERCFKSTISDEDLGRFDQIKETTPRRVVERPSSAKEVTNVS